MVPSGSAVCSRTPRRARTSRSSTSARSIRRRAIFRIDLYDGATGAKVASPVATVPAKGFAQIDRILAAYAPGVTQGCALVTKTEGANPFLAYAVLNDGASPGQRSGDGAYVASVPATP